MSGVNEPQKKAPKLAPPPTPWEKSKYRVYALILIGIVAAGFALAYAGYSKAFTPTIPVTLQADRAGLQMHENNRVKIRGVDLGRVQSVTLNDAGNGVDIELALDPDLARTVPTNATVSLEQLTAFGNKAIQFNYPANPSGQFLDSGSVIAATHVSTEVNNTFDELMGVLNDVQPSKLNATLGAFAQTFQGKGDQLGSTITKANDYFKKLNPELPALQKDMRSFSGFSQVYADAAPDIVDTARNAGVASKVFADPATDWPHLMRTLQGVGGSIDGFFGTNGDPLTDMLSSLRPGTSLLREYSPALTCFIDGASHTYDLLNTRLIDGNGFARFEVNMLMGQEPYQYPRDLPSTDPGSQRGPNCRGLPVVDKSEDSLNDYTIGPRRYNQDKPDNSLRIAQQPATVVGGLEQKGGR
jgi:phospholipid/cholesterol/gamma-HCH transport system substrate-binding protein